MKYFSALFLLFLLIFSGCAGQQNTNIAIPTKDAVSPVPVPITYTGRIPRINGDNIDVTLNFRPDGLYQLRQCKQTGNTRKTIAEMGHWKYDSTENLIVLGTKRGSLKTMTLVDDNTLRLLDVEGKDISSKTHFDLQKSETVDPFNDTVQLRGMYNTVDKIGNFVDCQNGIHFKMSKDQDYTNLEKTYNNTPHGQGEALLVTIEGSLQSVNGKEVLVVERFLEIKPQQDCTGNKRNTTLFDTTWKVIEIAGKPVTLVEGEREAYVILEVEGNRMHGFSGCNKFFGTYLVKGEIFVFNKMAGTRMACMKGLDLESDFLNAIHNTEAYRIVDGILELRDRDEQVLARLQAEK